MPCSSSPLCLQGVLGDDGREDAGPAGAGSLVLSERLMVVVEPQRRMAAEALMGPACWEAEAGESQV